MRSKSFVSAAVALLLLGFTLVRGAAGAQESFTLEQVMSAAFPTNLVAAADGSAVAWVLDERGARNVWIAEAPAFAGRRLTAYADDDGQEIDGLGFSADGTTVIYRRGGAPNRAGELPNPMSFAEGVKSEIRAVARAGGEPRLLAEGSGPMPHPRDAGLLFYRRGELMWLSLEPTADGEPATPRSVLSVRGGAGSVRYSPDGSRIAFASGRGTHAFVGVVDLDGSGPVQWLDPGVDSDGSPVWSPDGTRVAFLREPARRQLVIFSPDRQARPWSIRVADVAAGTSRPVFTAEDGAGSVFQGVGVVPSSHVAGALAWTADDRLVFPWERNGWLGLYSIPVAGGAAVPVAVGQFEVEQMALAAGGRELLVASNQDDVDRRHLWRVPADGSSPAARVTEGDWIEWSPVPVGADSVAFLRASGTDPAHAVIQAGAGAPRALAPEAIPADFPSEHLVQPQQVVFPGADGMAIHGQLFVPRDLQPGERRPAAIFFHGGSRRQMLLGFHYLGYYHDTYSLNQYLASRGYVVLSVNYRSGTGYGMEFREALDYGATGASEFNDVLGAGLYMRGRADVDPQRIGLWGGSYGGFLTAMGLARASDLFAAGVDIHGVHDWNDGIRIFVPGYDPTEDQERLAWESSPMASIDTWRSPVLLIHGDDDRNVFFSQSVYLTEMLRDRDVHVETLVFPDEVHGFLLYRNWLRAFAATADFFDRMLRR